MLKMAHKFEPGDVVKLNSDTKQNPDMTVQGHTGNGKVVCNWRSGPQPFEEEFDERQLQLVRSADDAAKP